MKRFPFGGLGWTVLALGTIGMALANPSGGQQTVSGPTDAESECQADGMDCPEEPDCMSAPGGDPWECLHAAATGDPVLDMGFYGICMSGGFNPQYGAEYVPYGNDPNDPDALGGTITWSSADPVRNICYHEASPTITGLGQRLIGSAGFGKIRRFTENPVGLDIDGIPSKITYEARSTTGLSVSILVAPKTNMDVNAAIVRAINTVKTGFVAVELGNYILVSVTGGALDEHSIECTDVGLTKSGLAITEEAFDTSDCAPRIPAPPGGPVQPPI